MSKLIRAKNDGCFALVDDDDYERCIQHDWIYHQTGYFWSSTAGLLHTFIVGPAPKGLVTDHINQNKLHNSKKNLRFVTQAMNCWNTKRHMNPDHSIFKQAGLFRVRLTRNKQQFHVGYFETIEKAREGRDKFLSENYPTVLLT